MTGRSSPGDKMPPAVQAAIAQAEVELSVASSLLEYAKLTPSKRQEIFQLLAGVISNCEQLKLWLLLR